MLFFGVFLHETACTAAKSRTNLSTNSGKATKRLDRLAPNSARVHIHLGIDIRQTNCPSGHKGALVGFRGSNIQVFGSCQTAGPIGTTFGTRLRIRLGMDIG